LCFVLVVLEEQAFERRPPLVDDGVGGLTHLRMLSCSIQLSQSSGLGLMCGVMQ
jgi:hypothetical protein